MKFADYVNATTPKQYVIWGLDLKPLCLGHYVLMKKYGCNYASDEPTTVDIADLIIGLIICSKSYEEAESFFQQDSIPYFSFKNLKSLGRAYFISRKYGGAGYYIRQFGKHVQKLSKKKLINVVDSFNLFQTYLTESRKMPCYWETSNADNGKSGAHWSIALYTTLTSKLGYTMSEAYNLPLSKAFFEYAKYAESEGAIELMNDDEEVLAGAV